MLPKKIYLNYVNEDDDALTWGEYPITCSDGVIKNREYTDLSQVWHGKNEKPEYPTKMMFFLDKDGLFYMRFLTFHADVRLTQEDWDFLCRSRKFCSVGIRA